jgi:hypothetical protein
VTDPEELHRQLLEEYEDSHLALIRLMSSGLSIGEVSRRLRLSSYSIRNRLPAARAALTSRTGLVGEALDSVFHPRPHGTKVKRKHFPRYSGAAVTIDRVQALAAFRHAAREVSDASREMQAWGLQDLARWVSGWRPADHRQSELERCVEARFGDDGSKICYIRPEGFRFKNMIGAISSLSLKDVTGVRERNALAGYLRVRVRDPRSSMIFEDGCLVAVPLSDEDRGRWEAFAAERGGPRAAGRALHVHHVPETPPRLSFEAAPQIRDRRKGR